MFKSFLLATVIAVLSGCSTTSVGLKYVAPASAAQVPTTAQPVLLGTFLDQRGEPPTWLGSIRGGFGNPLKTLDAERPVADLVRLAFSDALRARGVVIDQSAPYQIVGAIKRLDCSQYVRREAFADIEITILDKSGQQRFARRYTATNVDGSLLSFNVGIFASVNDLRVILEKTLREAIDQALDDTALRSALQF